MKTTTHTIVLSLIGAALILGSLLVTADDASADRLRLDMVKQRSGRMNQDRQPSVTKNQAHVIQLTGELRYSSRRGLNLDGTPLLLTGTTGVFPSPNGHMPSPRSLSGRSVTVYGVESPLGIRVRMIIDHDASSGSFSSTSLGRTQPEMGTPGPNPHARTLSPDNPS